MDTTSTHKITELGEGSKVFAPCRSKCPVHIDVPGYITAVAEGRFTDALEIVLERNPLPSVCGRVCLRPCEDGCRRCNVDQPLAIASLKRAASDFGAYPCVSPADPIGLSAAVVGAGPAGLTAAYDLALAGFAVTIYEREERLGGMMRYGIPSYRLPDEALDRDIDHILSLGIEVETGTRIGRDVTLAELHERHDAVVITAGLQGSRALPIPGADAGSVLAALPFLAAAARGEKIDIGKRVVVVGGGNVAMDVARTARRMGASEVHVVCLESADEMPASTEEIAEARTEGVKVHCSWGPTAVAVEEGGVCGLDTHRCVSVFDEHRRFSPTFDPETEHHFAADTVIFATGQSADVADLGLVLTQRGAVSVDPVTLRTSAENVYAAGDVVSGPTKIVDAIAAGHRVAACVLRDLADRPEVLAELDEESVMLGQVPETMKAKTETRRRIRQEKLEFYEAIATFDEVELGYTEYEAAREAQRCLGCTTGARLTREKCSQCLTCMRVCPYNAPGVKVGGFLYFDAETCHACGACASQCPAQAISLEGHSDEELMRRVESVLEKSGPDTTVIFNCSCTPIVPVIPGGNVHDITVTCLLRVSEAIALRTLRLGASRIALAGCVESNCRYPHTRDLVAQRIEAIRSTLAQIDLEDRLIVTGASPEEDVHLR